MQINKIQVDIIKKNIIIADNDNTPFVEHVFIPLEDWETIKNYIDNEIKSKKDERNSIK